MTDYRIIYDDPDEPNEPVKIVTPAPNWMKEAMAGNLPIISIMMELKDEEVYAVENGIHMDDFKHTPEKVEAQFSGKRTGPLTEEEAIEYLCLKDLPRKCWGENHNRPMFKIIKHSDIPTDRTFRDAWEMSDV